MTDRKSRKGELVRKEQESSLGRAFQDLSDGVVTLFRQHLELFREEAKRDARLLSKDLIIIVVGGAIAAVGYLLLWAAVIALVTAYASVIAGAWVALGSAIAHIFIGLMLTRRGVGMLKSQRSQSLTVAKSELERSSKWVKQITDSSSQQNTTTTS